MLKKIKLKFLNLPRIFFLIITVAVLFILSTAIIYAHLDRGKHNPDISTREIEDSLNNVADSEAKHKRKPRNHAPLKPPVDPYRPIFNYYPDTTDGKSFPLLSVISVFHDSDHGTPFRDTSFCILGQSLTNIEWNIVDLSTTSQDAKTLLDHYRVFGGPRVQLVKVGEYEDTASRNLALPLSKSTYVAFVNFGDQFEPTFFEKAVWFLETHPQISMVNGQRYVFSEPEQSWNLMRHGFQEKDLNLHYNLLAGNVVIRRNALMTVGKLSAQHDRLDFQEWDLYLRMANHGYWGYTIPEPYFWPAKSYGIPNNLDLDVSTNIQDADRQVLEFQGKMRKTCPNIFKNGFPTIHQKPPVGRLGVLPNDVLVSNHLSRHPANHRLMLIIPWMETGGADIFNLHLVRYLTSNGWEVTIVCTTQGKNKWEHLFQEHTSDIFILYRFLGLMDWPQFVAYLIRSRRPEVVLLSNSMPGYVMLPFLRQHARGPTYIDYVHSEFPEWLSGGYARFSAIYHEWLHITLCTSNYLKNTMIKTNRIDDHNGIAVVHCGVDTRVFRPSLTLRRKIRDRYGIDEDTPVIVFVGRIAPEKQPVLLTKIIAAAATEHKLHAFLIGDGPLMPQMKESITQLNLQDSVTVVGSVPPEQIKSYLSAADIFILPSKVEGISLALMEAMALGLYPIAADVGGQAELVPLSGEFGDLVKPGSLNEEQQYTTVLTKAVSDLPATQRKGRAAQRRVQEEWDIQNMFQDLLYQFDEATKLAKKENESDNFFSKPVNQEMGALGMEFFRMNSGEYA